MNFYFCIFFLRKRNPTTQFLGNAYDHWPGRSFYQGRRWHHFYLTRKIHHTGRFQTQEQKKLQGNRKLVHHPQGKERRTQNVQSTCWEKWTRPRYNLPGRENNRRGGDEQARKWKEIRNSENGNNWKLETRESYDNTEGPSKTHNTPHLRRHCLTGGAKEVATKPAVNARLSLRRKLWWDATGQWSNLPDGVT